VNAADDAERVSLLQTPRSRAPRELAPGSCRVGASVPCPGSGNMCAGDQCCPGTADSNWRTFPCPSATSGFADCEQAEREETCVGLGETAGEPNPPSWGSNVIIIAPGEDSKYQAQLQDIYAARHTWADDSQFGDDRTAVFLLPGNHSVDIDLPYYFSVYGLGNSPEDTVVKPGPDKVGLRVNANDIDASTNTFWRSIENLRATQDTLQFWVSQAAPLRSLHIDGSLELAGGSPFYASGGAMMNTVLEGSLSMGTQQQWYTRATYMPPYPQAAYQGSYVCAGCVDAEVGEPFASTVDWSKPGQNGHAGLSYTDAPETFAEKPYVEYDSGKYYLRIPALRGRDELSGPSWDGGEKVGFEKVFVASPKSSAATINAKIAAGLHVVFPPGIYQLSAPIKVDTPGIVLLGLGYATLIPAFSSGSLIAVGNVDGVRIAGLMLQAGSTSQGNTALLQWGEKGSTYAGSADDPGFIYDLCARAAGPGPKEPVGVEYFVQLNNGRVIGDNVWLWSADHCGLEETWPCPYPQVGTGLEVNADHVTVYGLMAEHTQGDIVSWKGEHGEVVFLQVEFRYAMGPRSGPKLEPASNVAYRVAAQQHKAVGGGIYVVIDPATVSEEVYPLSVPGGMTAVAIDSGAAKEPKDVWAYGFKDFQAVNWNPNWPRDSILTCTCATVDGAGKATCLDKTLGVWPWRYRAPLPSVSGIKGTHWADTSDTGGCSMPEAAYTVQGAVALGDAPDMGGLSAANNLCGHVVTVDCGGTPTVAVVASVCNIGDHSCGVDMITNTWNPATGNAPYGEVTCKLSLTADNALSGSPNQCIYRPDGVAGSSEYSTSVGLFNTGGKLVQSSTLAGIPGTYSGNSGYFDFDSQGQPLFVSSAELVTTFTDGSSVTTIYSSCVKPSGAHIFG